MKKTALQTSMILGAAYDWFFGLFILLLPSFLARIIQLDMPAQEVYLRMDGLFLVIIGVFYALYWSDDRRFREIVFIAITARFTGFLFFFSAWAFFAHPFTFLLLGIGDGFWGVLHLFLLKTGIRAKKDSRG
jgi:uncharacterized protein YjeT (DUF2065 family)